MTKFVLNDYMNILVQKARINVSGFYYALGNVLRHKWCLKQEISSFKWSAYKCLYLSETFTLENFQKKKIFSCQDQVKSHTDI